MDIVQVTLFRKPENGLVGVAIAMLDLKQGSKRLAHAYIHEAEAQQISVSFPSRIGMAELARASSLLLRFEEAVSSLNAKYLKGVAAVQASAGVRIRSAANALLRDELDRVQVHPCDEHDDAARAVLCRAEVQELYLAAKDEVFYEERQL